MTTSESFRETCETLLDQFPRSVPEIVVPEGGDGDFGCAQEMFARYGSDWDCEAIFPNRALINFVNDETFLFFLPRMVCCSYSSKGIDPDILDYVVFGLERQLPNFANLFSDSQRAALLAMLKIIQGFVLDEPGYDDSFVIEMQTILDALEDHPDREVRPVS